MSKTSHASLAVALLATTLLVPACDKSESKPQDVAPAKSAEKKTEEAKPKGCDAKAWKSPDGTLCFTPPDGFKPQDVLTGQIDQYGDKVNTSVAFAKGGSIIQLKWGTPSTKFDDLKKLAQDSAQTQTKNGGKSSVEDASADAYVFHSHFKGTDFTAEEYVFKLPKVVAYCDLTDFGRPDDPMADMKKACQTLRAQ